MEINFTFKIKIRFFGDIKSWSKKILLRTHSLFTDLLILKYLEECYHSGINATVNLLRTKFWIIRGRQTVKKYLKKCLTCKIVQGKTLKPLDSPSLPKF